MHDEHQWFIWNGNLGLLDRVTLGPIEAGKNGDQVYLEEPYDMVGPLDYHQLITQGRLNFAACTVMSAAVWQAESDQLRRKAHKNRQRAEARANERLGSFNQNGEQRPTKQLPRANYQHYRQQLDLPVSGTLKPQQIKSAYRKLAQKAHPDTGGNAEEFVRLTEARDALLELA